MLSPFDHKDYTTNSTTKKSFMDTVFNRKKLSKSDVFKFHGIKIKRNKTKQQKKKKKKKIIKNIYLN